MKNARNYLHYLALLLVALFLAACGPQQTDATELKAGPQSDEPAAPTAAVVPTTSESPIAAPVNHDLSARTQMADFDFTIPP